MHHSTNVDKITIDVAYSDPSEFYVPILNDSGEVEWCLPFWTASPHPVQVDIINYQRASSHVKAIVKCLHRNHSIAGTKLSENVFITVKD